MLFLLRYYHPALYIHKEMKRNKEHFLLKQNNVKAYINLKASLYNEIFKSRRMKSFYNKEINHKIRSKNKQAYTQTNKRTKRKLFEIVFVDKRNFYVVLAHPVSSEIFSRYLLLSGQTYHVISRLSFNKNTHHLPKA